MHVSGAQTFEKVAYLVQVLILCCIYSVLATSLDIVVGQTGILSLAHAASYSLGAYTSALLATRLGAPFYVGVLAGAGIAVLLSFAVSIPCLRLHEDYFVIVTFGFQVIVFNILNNWVSLTNGPSGIPGIPLPTIFGWAIRSDVQFAVVAATFAAAAFIVSRALGTSPFGRVLRAIREDEIFAESLGKDTFGFKVAAFAASAAVAATAGSLYANYVSYIDPTSFTVMESILMISMVIIGGAGSKWGPVCGAVLLVSFPEVLRFIGFPGSVAANLRQVFYGVLLVVTVIFRPQGLTGTDNSHR